MRVRGYPPGRNLPGRGRGIDQLELYSVYSGSYGGMGEKEDKSAIPAMGRWEAAVEYALRPLPGTRLSPPTIP